VYVFVSVCVCVCGFQPSHQKSLNINACLINHG